MLNLDLIKSPHDFEFLFYNNQLLLFCPSSVSFVVLFLEFTDDFVNSWMEYCDWNFEIKYSMNVHSVLTLCCFVVVVEQKILCHIKNVHVIERKRKTIDVCEYIANLFARQKYEQKRTEKWNWEYCDQNDSGDGASGAFDWDPFIWRYLWCFHLKIIRSAA